MIAESDGKDMILIQLNAWNLHCKLQDPCIVIYLVWGKWQKLIKIVGLTVCHLFT